MSSYSQDALGLLREAENRMLGAAALHDPAAGLVLAVDALRLTLVAIHREDEEEAALSEDGQWARVELFGHQVTHGFVRDVHRFGRRWLEVVKPATEATPDGGCTVESWPEESKLYHPNSVYALEESDEAAVLSWIRRDREGQPF
jgi:hypothetical protein